jgi:hypothetical protein
VAGFVEADRLQPRCLPGGGGSAACGVGDEWGVAGGEGEFSAAAAEPVLGELAAEGGGDRDGAVSGGAFGGDGEAGSLPPTSRAPRWMQIFETEPAARHRLPRQADDRSSDDCSVVYRSRQAIS